MKNVIALGLLTVALVACGKKEEVKVEPVAAPAAAPAEAAPAPVAPAAAPAEAAK